MSVTLTGQEIFSFSVSGIQYQITLAQMSTFAVGNSGVSAGGDLSGTYPNPTVAKINGVAPGAANGVATLNSSGVLTSTQVPTTLLTAGSSVGGDLSGTVGSATVAKLNGIALAAVGLPVSTIAVPNATIPVVSYSAATVVPTGTAATTDLAIVTSGQGALLTAIPDNTAVGGNKRGLGAVDLQGVSQRVAATQVASGQNSIIAGGNNNTSSGQCSFAAGNGCAATGNYTMAVGTSCTASLNGAVALGYTNVASAKYAVSLGTGCTASGTASAAIGSNATTNSIAGQVAFGHNSPTFGYYQHTFTQVYASTTSTTATIATADGTAASTTNQLVLRNNSAISVKARVVARDTVTLTDAACWTADLLVIRGASAATISIIGSPTVTQQFASSAAGSWAVAFAVDTTNGALKATVTSATTNTVRWNVSYDAIEVN